MRLLALLIMLSLVDFGTTILCIRWLGSSLTYTLFAMPMLGGLFIQWRRWKVMQAKSERQKSLTTEARGQSFAEEMTEGLSWMLVTALLLIPGLVTAGIAFALMGPFHKFLEADLLRYFSRIQEARILAQKAQAPQPELVRTGGPDIQASDAP